MCLVLFEMCSFLIRCTYEKNIAKNLTQILFYYMFEWIRFAFINENYKHSENQRTTWKKGTTKKEKKNNNQNKTNEYLNQTKLIFENWIMQTNQITKKNVAIDAFANLGLISASLFLFIEEAKKKNSFTKHTQTHLNIIVFSKAIWIIIILWNVSLCQTKCKIRRRKKLHNTQKIYSNSLNRKYCSFKSECVATHDTSMEKYKTKSNPKHSPYPPSPEANDY